MSGILTGSVGANCQLCIASFKEIHDIELIRCGYPINRNISAVKEIFTTVDKEEFLALPSLSDIDVI